MNWINVKYALPPSADYYKCKTYLIYCGYFLVAFWYNGKWVSDPDGWYTTYEPTHWCELTKPRD